MRKILTCLLCIILILLLCSCDENSFNNNSDSNEAVLSDITVQDDNSQFCAALFEKTSVEYNNELALICAYLSDKSEWDPPVENDKEDVSKEEDLADPIREAYGGYGIQGFEPFMFDSGILGGGAFAIGYKQINNITIIVITLRGSKTPAEFIGDVSKGGTVDFYGEMVYHNVYDFYDDIPTALEQYLNEKKIDTNGTIKYLINGHSLGGAAAGVLTAMLNNDVKNGVTKWGSSLKKEDVYCYTFGAIKTLSSYSNIEVGYENIHNIFNYYDSFAENGKSYDISNQASSYYHKFGHTEIYKLYEDENYNDFLAPKNHLMSNYINALEKGISMELACAKNEEVNQPGCNISDTLKTESNVSVTDFTIQGLWKSVGSYGFGQAQPGVTVTFDETHCNFYSPYDTYQFYQEYGKWRLSCKNVLWQDVQYFTVTILDSDKIEIVYDGSEKKTVLQRIQ